MPQTLTRRIRRILTELAAAQSAQDIDLTYPATDCIRLRATDKGNGACASQATGALSFASSMARR